MLNMFPIHYTAEHFDGPMPKSQETPDNSTKLTPQPSVSMKPDQKQMDKKNIILSSPEIETDQNKQLPVKKPVISKTSILLLVSSIGAIFIMAIIAKILLTKQTYTEDTGNGDDETYGDW